jgi:hypothetical protein
MAHWRVQRYLALRRNLDAWRWWRPDTVAQHRKVGMRPQLNVKRSQTSSMSQLFYWACAHAHTTRTTGCVAELALPILLKFRTTGCFECPT